MKLRIISLIGFLFIGVTVLNAQNLDKEDFDVEMFLYNQRGSCVIGESADCDYSINTSGKVNKEYYSIGMEVSSKNKINEEQIKRIEDYKKRYLEKKGSKWFKKLKASKVDNYNILEQRINLALDTSPTLMIVEYLVIDKKVIETSFISSVWSEKFGKTSLLFVKADGNKYSCRGESFYIDKSTNIIEELKTYFEKSNNCLEKVKVNQEDKDLLEKYRRSDSTNEFINNIESRIEDYLEEVL